MATFRDSVQPLTSSLSSRRAERDDRGGTTPGGNHATNIAGNRAVILARGRGEAADAYTRRAPDPAREVSRRPQRGHNEITTTCGDHGSCRDHDSVWRLRLTWRSQQRVEIVTACGDHGLRSKPISWARGRVIQRARQATTPTPWAGPDP